MIDLIVKAPIALSLALPPPKQDGTATATTTQTAVHDALMSIGIEWTTAGISGLDKLYAVVSRTKSLFEITALIVLYKLPITILHAQDALADITIDAAGVSTSNVTVHKQGAIADMLPFMPDVVKYNPTTFIETSRTPATTLSISNYGGHAAWQL